ncbi:MAG TPA: hypothetical protein VGD13_06765 [Xanthobacteraceae bacterium]
MPTLDTAVTAERDQGDDQAVLAWNGGAEAGDVGAGEAHPYPY